jgi:hypothetical protein
MGALVAAACLTSFPLRAGEPIRFSTTDQKKLEPAKPGSNPLEKYLDRPFESLRPDSSLGPVAPPQMLRPMLAPSLPEKSDREKAGWQNSWIFALPQEQGRQPTAEEIFKVERMGPDGRPMQKATLMEQYFKQRNSRFEEGRTGNANNAGANSPLGTRQDGRERSPSDLLNANGRSEDDLGVRRDTPNSAMRSILDSDAGRLGSWNRNTVDRGALGGEASLSEFFRASHEEIKKEKLREEKRQEYRLMLESRTYQDLQQGRREQGLGLQTPGMNETPTIGPSVLREAGGLARDLAPLNPIRQESAPLRNPSRNVLEDRRGGALGGYAPSVGPSVLPEPPRTSQQQRERPAVLPIPKRDF